ncbi:MAG: DUF3772 domain-containing protein, partial [Hyphomicrobiaceae bacterium]
MTPNIGCSFERLLACLRAVLAAGLLIAGTSALAQGPAPQPSGSHGPTAQPAPEPSHSNAEALEKGQAQLAGAEKEVGDIKQMADAGLVPYFRTGSTINTLETRRAELRALVDRLTPPMGDVKARLDKLGPPPKDGAQEPVELSQRRKQLTDEVAAFDSIIKRAEVLFVQAGQALATINSLRRARFTRQLLERSDEIGAPSFWQRSLDVVWPTTADVASQTAEGVKTIVQSRPVASIGGILLAMLAGFAVRLLCGRMLQTNSTSGGAAPTQTRAERGARVLRRATLATLPLAVAAGTFLAVMASAGLAGGLSGHVMRMALIYVVVAMFLISVLSHALTPRLSEVRLMPFVGVAARRLKVL